MDIVERDPGVVVPRPEMFAATPETNLQINADWNLPNDWRATVRDLCVAAREQRELAEGFLRRLVGLRLVATTSRRVLVVDDTPDSRDMAAEALEAFGFDAITASNGAEALIVAHYARPAVVVMDLTMPVLDGFEAARVLKTSPITAHLNVIAYTAKSDWYEGPLARLFAHVVTKPANPDAIVSSVRRFVVPWPPDDERVL
jgi:CheY-like chemotaxis protein